MGLKIASLTGAFVTGVSALALSCDANAHQMQFTNSWNEQSYREQVPQRSPSITDEWRVTFDNPRSFHLNTPNPIRGYDVDHEPAFSLSRDFNMRENISVSVQFDAQRDNGNNMLDVIRSGALPFSQGERVPGEGRWGMRFKKGASVQWSVIW